MADGKYLPGLWQGALPAALWLVCGVCSAGAQPQPITVPETMDIYGKADAAWKANQAALLAAIHFDVKRK